MSQIKLYSSPLSGHAHRVELFLRMLNFPYSVENVSREERTTVEFSQLNPLKQVSVLQDGDLLLSDSNAILVYLAKTYAPNSHWLPDKPLAAAQIQRWLSIAAGELKYGFAISRAILQFGYSDDLGQAHEISYQLLDFMDKHLSDRLWLATDQVSIADIACYSYSAHVSEGGVSLAPYKHVRRWIEQFEALPKFKAMAKLPEP